ncbi:MAG: hypothetical protein KatS3mg030_694 [Saprospiraceae bacterium]|nr:MAG: hypothetical protein KatS3mg030_694 [Saprospiraceae bacterium]
MKNPLATCLSHWWLPVCLLAVGYGGCIEDCEPVELPPDNEKECRALRMGLQQYDSLLVSLVLYETMGNYEPFPTSSDPCGHETNLLELSRLLSGHCKAYLQATVDCYACEEGSPRRSRLSLTIYRPDTTMFRILEVFTPCDGPLSLAKISDP